MKAQILGQGRIARAIHHLIATDDIDLVVGDDLGLNDAPQKDTDVIISTLPGGLGTRGLEMALAAEKHLLDLADLDDVFYLENKEQIVNAGITVIPGCGFSPGLTNFIIGHELASFSDSIQKVEVKAGSLSPIPHYFPFLWCFEDLVPEFTNPSEQIIAGEVKRYPAFSGERREVLWGIHAETYLGQSGFERFALASNIPEFTYRNIRPQGFRVFFEYLANHGCFETQQLASAKSLLESKILENYSVAEIIVSSQKKKHCWRVKSFAAEDNALNSMQKITASYIFEILKSLLAGTVSHKGLVFNELLGRDEVLFSRVIHGLQTNGIEIECIIT